MSKAKVLIVGAGKIAEHYLRILIDLSCDIIVVGRGKERINELKVKYPGIKTFSGGLDQWLGSNTPPGYAIIATPIAQLYSLTASLINAGCPNVLVEKPLTFNPKEAEYIQRIATERGSRVDIAFNRRNYCSVIKAKELIAADGGVSSFHFDFSEAIHRVNLEKFTTEELKLWGIANSSHVIDTAFYLGGKPKWMDSKHYGNAVDWHPAGSIFTGMGESINGSPFTYHANWGSPGRWNIEIMTPERRLLFSPMERLHQQLKGSFKIELVDLDYSLDIDYKPGFHQQVLTWINGGKYLMKLNELIDDLKTCKKIFSYE